MVLRREANLVKYLLIRDNKKFVAILYLVFSIIPLTGSSLSISSSNFLEKIGKRYQGIETIQCDFVQDVFLKDIKRVERGSGKFYYKRPSMARWDYERPTKQITLIKGNEIIIFDKAEGQTIRGRVDDDSSNALYLLLSRDWRSFERFYEVFNIKKTPDRFYKVSIRKKSNRMDPGATIWVTAEGLIISRIRFYDPLGNVIEIYFKNIKENINIDDSLFNPEMIDDKNSLRKGSK